MKCSLHKWKILQKLSNELKRNIRCAFVFNDGAIYVTKRDRVYGFGKNQEGFLGTGDKQPREKHTKIEQLCGQNIRDVQCSRNTFFAISASGSVFAWGKSDFGQLGLSTDRETLIPTKIEGILRAKRVVQVACSERHTLALTSDGELGLGHIEDRTLATKLDFPAACKKVTAIACLDLSSVALLDSGEVFAWGNNLYGILGYNNEDLEEQNIPRQVPGLDGITITRIVCGANHALAVSKNGKVYAWGCNYFGQLGNGANRNSHRPSLITGIVGRVRDVATHFARSVSAAVTEAGEVYVWGDTNGNKSNRPKKTFCKSLDEVFADIRNREFRFRPLHSILYEPREEKISSAPELPEWLKNSFDDVDSADVVFAVEGKKIHAHKAILVMRCEFFRAMYLGNWIESNKREQIIEHGSYDAFYAFLKYFYTNEVDYFQPDLALELFALAHFYCMTDLQNECFQIIQRSVTVENAASIYDQAILYLMLRN